MGAGAQGQPGRAPESPAQMRAPPSLPPPRGLGAWAQAAVKGRIQRAAVTQFPQAGSRGLLWTHRALHLEPQAETQEALAGDPGVANEGCLPALPDTPAPRKQVRQPRSGARSPNDPRVGGLRISLPRLMVASGWTLIRGAQWPRGQPRTACWLWRTAIPGPISKHVLSTTECQHSTGLPRR